MATGKKQKKRVNWPIFYPKKKVKMFDIRIDSSIINRWKGDAILAIVFMEEFGNLKTTKEKIYHEERKIINSLLSKGKNIFEDPLINRIRESFRAMPNMDPNRYRPASEALIRRVLNSGFFRINDYVDVNNLLSIRLKIPLGIYDLSFIKESPLSYRIGYRNEKYLTISRQPKSADGKIVLADYKGVIGSPVADSGRAPINANSKQLAVIAYLPFETYVDEASEILDEIRKTFKNIFQPNILKTKISTLKNN